MKLGSYVQKIKDAVENFSDFQEAIYNAWEIMDKLDVPGADDFLLDALSKGNQAFGSDLRGKGVPFEGHHVGTNKGKHDGTVHSRAFLI